MTNKKYFCYELYKNIAVWSNNGQITSTPCSFYSEHFSKSDTINLAEVWHSQERQKVLQMVDKEIPIPGCHTCYQAEAKGLTSRRLASFEIYEDWHKDTRLDLSGPQSLDYSVGNLCNLKCIICGPHNSSKWIDDYEKLYPEKNINFFKYQKHNQLEITDPESLKNIITVHFHGGGEPLLSDAHYNLLKRIEQVKGLSDVRVFYNTNGTVTVDDKVLKLWEQCKLIELYFSIDDIYQRFDYQRPGSSFQLLEQNLQWYKNAMPHNHLFKVNAVWGYLNLFYLDQLVAWQQENFAQNRYGDPVPLIFQKAQGETEIKHLSEKCRNILLEKFSKHPELVALVNSLETSDQPHSEFLSWIKKLDHIRNQNFAMIQPEWAKLLDDTV